MHSSRNHLESGSWKYLVLVAKFSNHVLQQGIMKSLGVLIPSLVFQLNTTYATIGFLVSLQITMNYMACPLAQLLIHKFDARLVAALGGLGTGLAIIGSSFTRAPVSLGMLFVIAGTCSSPLCQLTAVVLRQHFGAKFGSANSVSYLGSLVGGMTIPFLTGMLYDAYGLSGALLCLGGLFLNSIPIGLALRPPHDTVKYNEEEEQLLEPCHDSETGLPVNNRGKKQSKSMRRIVTDLVLTTFDFPSLKKELSFSIFFLPCQIFLDVAFIGWALFMVSYAVHANIASYLAVYLPVAGACGGFVIRTCLAIMMHRKPKWSPYMYALNAVISAVSLFLYPVYSSLPYLLVCSFFAGCGLYGAASTYYAVISVTISEENFPGILAFSFFISGIGAASAGTLTGYLFDVTGSFETVFRILGGFMVAVFVLVCIYIYDNTRRKSTRAS